MKRTSKALARIGIGAVTTAAILATPLALGTAAADPSFAGGNLVASGTAPGPGNLDPKTAAYGTAAPLAVNPVPQNTITAGAAQLFAYHNTNSIETLAFTITGSSGTAYFLAQAAQTPNVTVTNATHATCTTVVSGTDTQCSVLIGDTASEGLVVQVTDAADSTLTSGNVNFNGLHWTQCSQTGVNIATGVAGDPNVCKTQGTVNTPTTTTFTYLEAGAPAASKNIEIDVDSGAGQFTGTQPAGTAFFSTTQVNCTTDASGKCSVQIVDATQNDITVLEAFTTNPTPYPTADAQESIKFQAANVAPAELDLDASKVIAPGNQPTGQFAEPGDVIQNVYTLRGSTVAAGAGTPVCVPTAPASVCPGLPLANQTFTLKVSDGFFTPNCGSPATPVEAASPGYPNLPTLGSNNYANCTFNAAPAAGTAVGDLKDGGQSIDLKTDDNGQVIVSLGIAKDAGFDDDGFVVAAVSDGSIVPQVEGDGFNPAGATCAGSQTVLDPDLTSTGTIPAAAFSGCDIDTAWSTDEAPLNGGTVKDVVIPAIRNPNNNFISTENNDTATDTGTTNVPDVDRVVWVLHLTDQFGNLTSNDSAPIASTAGVQKTGPGNIVLCTGFTAVDACDDGAFGIPGVTQPDGTVTQQIGLDGSYTNNDPAVQNRIEADANTAGSGDVVNGYPGDCPAGCEATGNPGVNDGTQTDISGWQPEVTDFASFIAGTPAFATYAPQGAAATPSIDTLTLNFYNQLAQAVVTFSVKPGHKVPTSTAVTVASTVTDQFTHPIVDADLQFVRSGSNEPSCTPIQNAQNDEVFTNQAGKGGYTFSCNQPGASTVNVVVTGPGGTQLAAGKEVVHFTGKGTHVKKEKPSLKAHAKGHHVTLSIATHPKVHGKTVHFYKLVHGLRHLVGAAKTSKSGHATLHLKLKSGKYHFDAKVSNLKATKYSSKYSKTKTLTV